MVYAVFAGNAGLTLKQSIYKAGVFKCEDFSLEDLCIVYTDLRLKERELNP